MTIMSAQIQGVSIALQMGNSNVALLFSPVTLSLIARLQTTFHVSLLLLTQTQGVGWAANIKYLKPTQ